jgi:hypothetical protein
MNGTTDLYGAIAVRLWVSGLADERGARRRSGGGSSFD